VTTIILVRHGHVDWIVPERFRGRADLDLSDLGWRQVAATAQRIASAGKPAAIYSSPMRRCINTAEAIASNAALDVVPLDGFNDIDYGEWQGLTRGEAHARWPSDVDCWFRAPHLASIPRGESLMTLLARSTAALRSILQRHPGQLVVVVGHDSVNRVLLLFALDLPISRYWHLKQAPGAINEVGFEHGSFVIRTLNETGHLVGL
jgi:broad specificity phosphatase PhoE